MVHADFIEACYCQLVRNELKIKLGKQRMKGRRGEKLSRQKRMRYSLTL